MGRLTVILNEALINVVTRRFTQKIIGNIKSLAEKGVTTLLDALGLELQGSVKMDTPTW